MALRPEPPDKPGYVGSTWRFTDVVTPHGSVVLRADSPAGISFGADGSLRASDNVNAYSGRYETSETGYRVTDIAMTLRAYLGDDPQILATKRAVQEMTNARAEIRADLHGDSLVIAAGGYQLRCRREAAVL